MRPTSTEDLKAKHKSILLRARQSRKEADTLITRAEAYEYCAALIEEVLDDIEKSAANEALASDGTISREKFDAMLIDRLESYTEGK